MREVTFIARLTVLGGTALALGGCGSRPGIVGQWSGTMPTPGGGTVTQTLEFKPDGTLTQTAPSANLVATATYTVSGDTLTMTPTGATVGGRAIPLPPQAKAPQVDKFKVDGDTLTITANSVTVALSRVKS